ncbi:LysR substrate-binding domain-containing protein [Pseudomonas sp. DR48]|uniref:LysR substrate-binding domain-containing protein n=1 Tax=Pseudomonas sp. DR48 TaxID=2871095 RepID=UPI001C9980FD|nr:LysR substrate-binding domain-containing protein [Pseudomonas sp. DR48]QZP31053.1 hypothetical protein K5K95_23035 [Pseudomonas sp. DR48]
MNYRTPHTVVNPALRGAFSQGLHVGISTDVEYVFLPQLLCKLRSELPGIPVIIRSADPSHMPSMLASGEISFAIGPDSLSRRVPDTHWLRSGRSMVLRADSSPGALSLKEICYRPHAAVSFAVDIDLHINGAIRELGHQRSVVMQIPHFESLPGVLAGTDCLAIVPDYVAEQLVKKGGLRSETVPISEIDFGLFMSWQASSSNDPASRWLRSRCSMILGNQ